MVKGALFIKNKNSCTHVKHYIFLYIYFAYSEVPFSALGEQRLYWALLFIHIDNVVSVFLFALSFCHHGYLLAGYVKFRSVIL